MPIVLLKWQLSGQRIETNDNADGANKAWQNTGGML